ncbi:hypothetical protein ABWH96_09725 [Marivirga tractuosa]|uniref:hypothetical protein n=1 Tax=Marivirga tractuosa TaxID=1006 RepID=UPI0035CFB8CF
MNSKQSKSNGDFKMNGDWDTQSKQLKSDYPELTDSDLRYEKGKENELCGRVENRLNKDRNTVMGILNENQSKKPNQSEKRNQPIK